MTPNQKKFYNFELEKAKSHGITVDLVNSYVIPKMKCSGYFDEETLAVAIKRNPNNWFQVFIHETCHMDQFLEKSSVWNRKIKKKYCPLELYEMYIDGVIETTDEIAFEIQKYCVEVEWDCEKRSVKKIRKNDLGINIEKYTQEANLYLYLYPFCFLKRKWHSYTKIRRNNPDIIDSMPRQFLKKPVDYIHIPNEILKQLEKGIGE